MTNEEKRPGPASVPTETILKEIGKEKHLIVSLNDTIGEIERATDKLEQEIINHDISSDARATRWKEKFHTQVRVNEQLENRRSLLQEQLETEQAKITNGWSRYPCAKELESGMSEAELQRLVRQLEMVRQNLIGELRDVQWRLDQESKSYHRINDRCHIYNLEINTAKSSVLNQKQMKSEDSRLPRLHGITFPTTTTIFHILSFGQCN